MSAKKKDKPTKMGRPPKYGTAMTTCNIRITADDMARVERAAAKAGLTRTEYMREAILAATDRAERSKR